jgi:aspartyl-tRNA(Asn)/glutamyl-tRNA(Gln) amidotransferase subunit A
VAGIKPTYGLVPTDGIIPLSWSLDHVGPLARSVADLALVLGVMAGQDHRAAVDRPDQGLAGVRVGVPRTFFWERADPEVLRLAEDAVGVLRELGAEIVEVDVPFASHAGSAAAVVMSVEATAFHERHLRAHLDDYGDDLRLRLLRGFFLSGTDYLVGLRAQAFLRRAFADVFRDCDLLATPTAQVAAAPIDEDPASAAGTSLALSVQLTRFTNPFNVTGFPALSVPCGFTARGLPAGLQIVGRPHDEVRVLQAGAAYEAAAGWNARRPPLD